MLSLKSRKTGFEIYFVIILCFFSALSSCAKAKNIERLSQTLLPELPDFDFDDQAQVEEMNSLKSPNNDEADKKEEYPLAGNLGGTDRFLVFSPFARVLPADFTIGKLLDPERRTEFAAVNDAIIGSLGKNELPLSVMTPFAIEDAYVLFGSWLKEAGKIENIRVSEPVFMQDGSVSMRIKAGAPDASIEGFVVLFRDSAARWTIEYMHIEKRLFETEAPEKYDPYKDNFF